MAEKPDAQVAQQANTKETAVPEWEHIATAQHEDRTIRPRSSLQDTLEAKLNTLLPKHKKYLGLRRNAFLIVLLIAVLALLVLIIGLAAGLSQGSRYVLGGKSWEQY